MNYSYIGVMLDETPNEIALTFKITGCQLACPGCQAAEFWGEGTGEVLTQDIFFQNLKKYKGSASAVLFMGGEWHEGELIGKLRIAKLMGYKTILYTGLEKKNLSSELLDVLDYLKYGPYNEEAGPITSKTTNQVYENLHTGESMNHYFIKSI